MRIDEILEILKDKEIVIDFLGYNEINGIIERILNNEELLEEVESIPISFWQDVLTSGIIVYSHFTYKTEVEKDEKIIATYTDVENKKKKMPTFIYEKKRKLENRMIR